MYKVSRYNYWLEHRNVKYIFNTLQATLVKIPTGLEQNISNVNSSSLNDHFAEFLRDAGIIVKKEEDESGILKKRLAKRDEIFKVTIAPTLLCNLRCIYCYQGRSSGIMDITTCDRIIEVLKNKLVKKKFKSLFVDWYGGEPLMAIDIIEYFSGRIIDICVSNNIEYNSTIVSNGTLIGKSTLHILKKCGISTFQITIDGPGEINDKYRPFSNGRGSYYRIFHNLKIIAGSFNVNLRINVDINNIDSAYILLDELAENDLLKNEKFRFIPYISMLGKLSDTCNYSMQDAIDITKFYDYAIRFQNKVIQKSSGIALEDIVELPKKLSHACGARDPDSLCIDPYGNVYKCGLELHETEKGCGKIWKEFHLHDNFRKWFRQDPLKNEKCNKCIYLPICLGGCRKYSFDRNRYYEYESCNHWNLYFEKIISNYLENKIPLPGNQNKPFHKYK